MTSRGGTYTTNTGEVLVGVHPPQMCVGRVCVIHSPTEHHMREWPQVWREDTQVFERTCAHGIGHPDPDQFDYWQQHNLTFKLVHGCDGCCGIKD